MGLMDSFRLVLTFTLWRTFAGQSDVLLHLLTLCGERLQGRATFTYVFVCLKRRIDCPRLGPPCPELKPDGVCLFVCLLAAVSAQETRNLIKHLAHVMYKYLIQCF